MDAVFYLIPLLIAGIAIAAAVAIVFRARERSRAWNSGLVAEARCLDVHTTTHQNDDRSWTVRHFVFEFTTAEGRTVRFEEEDLPGTVLAGDTVPVHYAADRPERATAQAPSPLAHLAGVTGQLVFLGVIVVFCVLFMMMVSAMPDDVLTDVETGFETGL